MTKRRGVEKRKYPRIEAKVKVDFRTLGDLASEFTRNISRGGIFLRTNEPLDPNAEVELTITFPDGMGSYKAQGRVKRLISMTHPTDPNKQIFGVGLQFIKPDTELMKTIEEMIQVKKKS